MGAQEAVDLGDVDPAQQVWVVGAVRAAVGGGAVDGAMNGADAGDGAFGDVDRPEGGGGEELAGPLQAAPRIAAVAGVPGDAGHRQRVKGLQHEGPQTADEHRRVAVDRADRRIGGEPARPGSGEDPASDGSPATRDRTASARAVRSDSTGKLIVTTC